jgi:monoamine oxidase
MATSKKFPIPTQLTRRRLIFGMTSLGGLGAAQATLAALGLVGPTDAFASAKNIRQTDRKTEPLSTIGMAGKHIVVIGSGLAGLCSALRLSRAGAKVTILEATNRMGGRSLTLRHGDRFQETDWLSPTTVKFEQVGNMLPNDTNNFINTGPGRIPQHHARVLDYCKELQVELQPFTFQDGANLMQNDKWNDGRPVQVRRLTNDLRGHLAEMLAKVQNQGKLDELLDSSEVDAFLGMLEQFGQLSAEGARLVYKGASLTSNFPRAGYAMNPGDIGHPGTPWPTLSLPEILQSKLWQQEIFLNLEYFWQATLLQPVNGMDQIVKGFERAQLPNGLALRDLVILNTPVKAINVENGMASVMTHSGKSLTADYVIATLAPTLLAQIGGNFMDDTSRQMMSSVKMTNACKVAWQSKYRFWEEENRIYGGISYTKDIITQIWYPSFGFNQESGVLMGAYNMDGRADEFQTYSREKRLDISLKGGEKLHPGFTEKVFAQNGVSIAWGKMPYQAGAWASDTSFTQPALFEQLKKIDAMSQVVYPAGDWYSYWPGWQEGALDSAHYATDNIQLAASKTRSR